MDKDKENLYGRTIKVMLRMTVNVVVHINVKDMGGIGQLVYNDVIVVVYSKRIMYLEDD